MSSLPHRAPRTLSKPRRSPIGTALAICAILGTATCSEPAPRLPNVLFVVTDTLRADHVPWNGYERETTPFLSTLAERGVVFERAYSSSTWTAPSMASIFTGVLPSQHGVLTGYAVYGATGKAVTPIELNRIPQELETLPEMMEALGYRTFGVADNANIRELSGFTDGFDRFTGLDYQSAEVVNAELAKWEDEITAPSEQPWFVYLHYMDPHGPYHKRAPHYDYDESVLEIDHSLAPPASVEITDDPWIRRYEIRQLFYRIQTAATPEEGELWAARIRDYLNAVYDSEIAYFDAHLAEAWERIGADEETLFVFLSDHGEELGDHGAVGHGFQMYDELLRVPLLFVPPRSSGHAPGRVAGNVTTIDVLPTVRDLLGLPPSKDHTGVSLAPWLADASLPVPDRTLLGMRTREIEGKEAEHKTAVVAGGDKLILSQPDDVLELFDLLTDPGERDDRASVDAETAQLLRRAIDESQEGLPRWERLFVPLELTAEQRNRIEELGYGGE